MACANAISATSKEFGLKLIIGSEFCLEDGLRLVLLARNRAGYGDLAELITRARRGADKGEYRLSRQDLVSLLRLPDPDAPPHPDHSSGSADAETLGAQTQVVVD